MTAVWRNLVTLLRQMVADQVLWAAYAIAPAETKPYLLRALSGYFHNAAAWFRHAAEQAR